MSEETIRATYSVWNLPRQSKEFFRGLLQTPRKAVSEGDAMDRCKSVFEFEPSDDFYGIELQCDLPSGHAGNHCKRLASAYDEPVGNIFWDVENAILTDRGYVKIKGEEY